MTYDELIAALEAASEGSRELEVEIGIALDHKARGGSPNWQTLRDYIGYVHQIPRWTRSLDAAVSLIPDGLSWMVAMSHTDCAQHGAWVWDKERGYGTEDDFALMCDFAATAPLAMCIAALKARRAMEPDRMTIDRATEDELRAQR